MREAFVKTLYDLTLTNKNVCLLTGDLGFTVFEKYKKKFPDNFFNMGVAEANMVGVAAGLAMSGKVPFVYSIAPFVTLRAYEQIKNDVCLHGANVKIVGVGGGLAYSTAGPTHHALEDISAMRSLPGMTVLCPSDPNEVVGCVKAAVSYKGPVYLRLGKKGEPVVNRKGKRISIGEGTVLRGGKDVTVVGCGPIIANALEAANALKADGLSVGVVSMTSVKPIDKKLLSRVFRTPFVCVVEEHNIIGGLGSAVSEFLAENQAGCAFKRIGINDAFVHENGDYEYLRDINGLSSSKIASTIKNWVNGK